MVMTIISASTAVCAPSVPTAAWDMKEFELVIPYALSRSEPASVATA
jgi:hypothetical protein